MSFWNLSDGTDVSKTHDKSFEMPTGNIEVIPDGSRVKAAIDEAKWDDKDGARFISIRWAILAPEEVKNRKVFQKLWVKDDDPNADSPDKAAKKRDKAKRMLAAIDSNAAGKLSQLDREPTDEDLASLMNAPMVIRTQVWSMTDRDNPGEKIEGNWISAVMPSNETVELKQPAKKPAKPHRPSSAQTSRDAFEDDDDDIPF